MRFQGNVKDTQDGHLVRRFPTFRQLAGILALVIVAVVGFLLSCTILSSCLTTGSTTSINIGLACVKVSPDQFKCVITSADSGVDFQKVSIMLRRSGSNSWSGDGELLGLWLAPISFPASGTLKVTGAKSPLSSDSWLVDEGVPGLGPGDYALLNASSGETLSGNEFWAKDLTPLPPTPLIRCGCWSPEHRATGTAQIH